ncbi:MAG: hypothetical protein CVT64_07070 [Actinobacteria bacterium HGW-Actinobacteria-4]|nr:MAG: hypothetical protein CVT64_07070 [Actinobacteria bacterium HGW-Actinobacteria-4]
MARYPLWKFNDVLADEWGKRLDLKHAQDHLGSGQLANLVDKRTPEIRDALNKVSQDRNLELAVLDHARSFRKVPGSSQIVAVTSAPYLKATLGWLGDPDIANARIHEIAKSLGLSIRVGHPYDVTYLSTYADDPTLPIVWWNPDRIRLPFPPIDDPWSRFAERIEENPMGG